MRDALRASGSVMLHARQGNLPFDIAGQRTQRYTLDGGAPDAGKLEAERAALTAMLQATMADWRGRRASPVYAQLPNLEEPDWRKLKLGAVNEYWQGLDEWQDRVKVAVRRQCAADIMVLADDTPNRVLEFEALRTAADALIKLKRPHFALGVLRRAAELNPDDAKCRQLEAIALGRTGRYDDAREKLNRLAEEQAASGKVDGETLGLLARTWKDDWSRGFDGHPLRRSEPLAAARDTATTLKPAAEAYAAAFTAAPADYYPGINALTAGPALGARHRPQVEAGPGRHGRRGALGHRLRAGARAELLGAGHKGRARPAAGRGGCGPGRLRRSRGPGLRPARPLRARLLAPDP